MVQVKIGPNARRRFSLFVVACENQRGCVNVRLIVDFNYSSLDQKGFITVLGRSCLLVLGEFLG